MKKAEEILNKILLPLNSNWKITDVQLKEATDEVFVELEYDLPYTCTLYEVRSIEADGHRYSIYDHRPLRSWRHLDLWQYKTLISARLPRYKDEKGFYHTVDIPWAEQYDQMTVLLKKNCRNASIN